MEKVHAVVARSTFGSKNAQNTSCFGRLLEVAMSKKCTPLWREAHFEVKSVKTHRCSDHFWTIRWRFDVEKVHAVVARSTFQSKKCKNTEGFEPLLDDSIYKKCTPLWREAHFQVKSVQQLRVSTTTTTTVIFDVQLLHYNYNTTTKYKYNNYNYNNYYNYNLQLELQQQQQQQQQQQLQLLQLLQTTTNYNYYNYN